MLQSTLKPKAEAGKSSLRWKHLFEDLLTAALLAATRILPYRQRIGVLGWIGAYVIGPVAGVRPRIRSNLALIAPDLTENDVRHICRRVPGNMIRALAETFVWAGFHRPCQEQPH
jgi:KDO2-lipid IV(A) lauroyltransferase